MACVPWGSPLAACAGSEPEGVAGEAPLLRAGGMELGVPWAGVAPQRHHPRLLDASRARGGAVCALAPGCLLARVGAGPAAWALLVILPFLRFYVLSPFRARLCAELWEQP